MIAQTIPSLNGYSGPAMSMASEQVVQAASVNAFLIVDGCVINISNLNQRPIEANSAQHAPIAIDDVVAQFEQDPQMADAIKQARARFAHNYQENLTSLAALRLSKGLSQADVARRLGTQQPNVARWERPGANPGHATIMRLATALEVDPQEVMSAIGNQKT